MSSFIAEPRLAPLMMIGPYMILKELGQGAYATVWLGVHSTSDQKVALKVINKKHIHSAKLSGIRAYHRIETEVGVLNWLNHPHITSLVDFFETAEQYVIVMEYVAGPTFYQYLRRRCVDSPRSFTADQKFRLFHQLLSAVDACHSRGIAHRDIKVLSFRIIPAETVSSP